MEELAWELKTCDTEWPFLLQVCETRLRIYQGLKSKKFYQPKGFFCLRSISHQRSLKCLVFNLFFYF
ncbi:hypothetical protein TDIS_2103 [Thermosulfurimonas dismutans]|uniref:Uncharacterized protein n=1 Tax=Thermosulfurimonas dismutans TaxID=999894 RepID=A0A179D266_9BACT|nr:hypothetical protein TDIS_2103 [Thermosulfurimonas dismutans]